MNSAPGGSGIAVLAAGVLLWSLIHLFPSRLASVKAAIVARIGLLAYRGLFAGVVVCSIVLMVHGWKNAIPVAYYAPLIDRHVAAALMLPALILLCSTRMPTNVRRLVRHPQLAGLLLWSVTHLLANGDSRALILFGGLGAWAAITMLSISRNEGPWRKPAAFGPARTLLVSAVGAMVWFVLLRAHAWFAGVPVWY